MATVAQPEYEPVLMADPLVKMHQYVAGVLSGEIVVCELVRQAVERHVHDLETAEKRGLYFDEDEARYTVQFIETLRHSKGKRWAGKRLIQEPWQAFIVGSLFGWKRYDEDSEDWVRRFNTGFISTGRKTGKSTEIAAIGHRLFVGDNEPGAEVYTAATKFDQAKIVHEEAKRMVRKSPGLRNLVEVRINNLYMPSTESKYVPLGADRGTEDGLNVHAALVDEIHAHATRGLWDVLNSATGARDNPMILAITTAGEAGNPDTIYHELKSHTIKVLQGIVTDDTWFGFIATLDKDDDWSDEDVWPKANPDAPYRPEKRRDLRKKVRFAKTTPGAVPDLLRRCFNVDVDSLEPWVTDEAWTACSGGGYYEGWDGFYPPQRIINQFRDRPCYVGGDLSSLSDLTSLVFCFPDEGQTIDVLPFCWCPHDNAIGRTRDKRVPYMQWSEMGRLRLTEGNSVDYDELRHLLVTARDTWRWDIKQVRFDPNNARYLITKLAEEDGFVLDQTLFEHLQTTGHMNEPINTTEAAVINGRLRHGGHPVLRWCVSNVKIYRDTGGRRRFDKKKSTEKIDAAVAMAMGVGEALVEPAMQVSVYETRGVTFG